MQKKPPVMDWQAIKAELHRRGMTLTELGKRNGVHPGTYRSVPVRTNYAAQAAIAAFIDQKPEDLWPDRYPRGGHRILDTAKYPPMNSQKSASDADSRKVA